MRTSSPRTVGLLAAWSVLVPLVAAADVVAVRLEVPWRANGPLLYLQALGLWAVLGLLACAPAALTARLLRGADRPGRWACRPAILAGWMLGPLLVHGVLDRHVEAEFDGRMALLAAAGPWLEVLALLAVLVLVLAVTVRGLERVTPGRTGAALIAGTLVTLALMTGALLPWRGQRERAAPTPAPGAPNLLLLVWDTTRSDLLQPYGFERGTTPALARFAEEAWIFEDSVSTAVFTFSSHLSLLTGVYPSGHGARLVSMQYDPRRATSLATTLRSSGYRTGAFVGTDVLTGTTGMRHGFDVYDDEVDPPVCATRAWAMVHDLQTVLARHFPALRNNGQPHWIEDFQRPAEEVLERALAWIEEDDERPWFCFVNLYDVHWPYLPSEAAAQELVSPYDGPLDGYLFRSDAWSDDVVIGEEDRRHVSELYQAELLELDREVDAFLSALALEEGGTAVLLTSDHGEAFGEAGRWKHEDISEPQVRVPFLLRLPEREPQGRRIPGPVSGVDVAPTLLALAGVDPPYPMDGRSLLSGSSEPERVVLVEDRDHVDVSEVRIALYRGPFKLVRHGLGEAVTYALYDLRTDSLDEVDVQERHPEVFRELVRLLTERRAAFDAAEAEAAAELGGQADALRALGYMGG